MSTVPHLYKRLLAFYPKAFREQLGESMEQTFNDLWNEKRLTNQGLLGFVLWTFIETSTGILQEHVLLIAQGMTMKNITTNPKLAALVGILFCAPFALLNTIVASRIEPFFSLLRPGIHTGPFEYPLLFIVLLLIPVGSFVAIRPMLPNGIAGKRKFYLVNMLFAALLLLSFVLIVIGLGMDIYRCDILQIPNCD